MKPKIGLIMIALLALMGFTMNIKAQQTPDTTEVGFPIDGYVNNNSDFLNQDTYDGNYWGYHLGEDMEVAPGTKVMAIGDGVVVYSGNVPGYVRVTAQGTQVPIRNWGHIIVIAHRNPVTGQEFQSVYGHLGQRLVEVGDTVTKGQELGDVGETNTSENGMWHYPHLHWAIYTGPNPWRKPNGATLRILPGYYKASQGVTRLEWWIDPSDFVNGYRRY